jgi:hypothetical protein
VPRLWDETIEAHRRVVRDATLNTTAALVAEHGLASVTMSQIAAETGIGRATLYKYSRTWRRSWSPGTNARSPSTSHNSPKWNQAGPAGERLTAVLEAYALIVHERHGSDLAASLHRVPMSPKPTSNSGTSSGTC